MASAKVATKAAADDRTDMVIPPSMCAASRSSLISLSSGRAWCDRMVAAVNPPSRGAYEPAHMNASLLAASREDKVTHPPSKAYQQSTRAQTSVDWDAVAQFWHRRPAYGLGSAGTGLTRTSFATS